MKNGTSDHKLFLRSSAKACACTALSFICLGVCLGQTQDPGIQSSPSASGGCGRRALQSCQLHGWKAPRLGQGPGMLLKGSGYCPTDEPVDDNRVQPARIHQGFCRFLRAAVQAGRCGCPSERQRIHRESPPREGLGIRGHGARSCTLRGQDHRISHASPTGHRQLASRATRRQLAYCSGHKRSGNAGAAGSSGTSDRHPMTGWIVCPRLGAGPEECLSWK